MRSCLPGHNFVNISLRLYACRAGPPCRYLGYRLPGSRLKRADFSHINRRNGPARLLRTRSITFGAVSQKIFPCSFNFTQKNDGTWLLIAGLAHFRISHIIWSQMLDKFDELSSWSRNAHRGGRIHRSLRHFPLRRVALDFVEGTEHAFSLRHCVGMTLRSGI